MLNEIKQLNKEFYNWAAVELNDPDNTNPYLIIPDERYQNASFRILVLGKETNGWGEGKDENCHSAKDLEKLYVDKIINKEIGRSTAFWDFYFSWVWESLKERSDVGVCVSNVALLGYRYEFLQLKPKGQKEGYNKDNALKLSEFLGRYINILKPNAIICFTGFGTKTRTEEPYLKILEHKKHLWGSYIRDNDKVLDTTCKYSMRKLTFVDSKGIEVYGTCHPGWRAKKEIKDKWKQSIVNSILNDIIPKPQAEAKADGSADDQ